MGDNRPSVYEEDGKVVYRASAVGGCVRALVASQTYDERRGKDVVDLLERSAREGDIHEEAERARLIEEEGFVSVRGGNGEGGETGQYEVEIPVVPGVIIRGHVDDLVRKEGFFLTDEGIVEIKSMSTKQFSKWMSQGFHAFPRYAWQISCYMKGLPNRDVLYLVKRREDGQIDRQILPAGKPPVPWKTIKAKIIKAERYRRADEFPPCDAPTWGCPFWYLHDEQDPETNTLELNDELIEAFALTAMEYRKLKDVEDKGKEAASERKKKHNHELLNLLGDADTVEFEYEGQAFKITRGKGGSTSLDSDGLKAEIGKDLYAKYEKKVKYEYPIVKVKPIGKK